MPRPFSYLPTAWLAKVALCAALLQTGCIILPLPWKAEKPAHTEEQLARVQVGVSTRDAVREALWVPDVEAADGRYWAYAWQVGHGKLITALLLDPSTVAGGAGPLYRSDFVLFLEFDEKGVLRRKEFGNSSGTGSYEKFCTSTGVCLEHKVDFPGSRPRFRQGGSAITVVGGEKDSLPWPALPADQCMVVIWPDPADWEESHGLYLSVAGSSISTWLPVGSYLAVSLPAGEQTVDFRSPWTQGSMFHSLDLNNLRSSTNLQLEAGRVLYFEVAASSRKYGRELPANLKPIEPETGKKTVAGMSRVLLQ